MSTDDGHDLELLLDSHVPLIVAETREENRVIGLLQRIVPPTGMPLYQWSVAEGLRRADFDMPAEAETAEPAACLRAIKSARQPGVYLLADFHPYLEDPVNVRLAKEIALQRGCEGHKLIFVSHSLDVPEELRGYTARFELSLPDAGALRGMIEELAREWSARNGNRRVRTDRETLDRLVNNLTGLTMADARRLARGVIEDDGAISEDDLPEVMQAKYRLLDRTGALSFEFDTARFSEVGGLSRLKQWVRRRKSVFLGEDELLTPPKGILLVGVQGAGKSLAAKAVAGLWGLPLLRLDVGTLYNKYFGESERNLREAIASAEVMAPCVLWIDEIEKAMAQGESDGGVSRRMLGTLLTWMAEKREAVFLVATANDIQRLPPELIRKGRMDEIFFVDLPTEPVRAEIFRIHLDKRDMDAEAFDLQRLAAATDGFSGAEIEQAIVSGLYLARERREPLNTAHLLIEAQATSPLSVVMAERLAELRRWADGRTVPAD